MKRNFDFTSYQGNLGYCLIHTSMAPMKTKTSVGKAMKQVGISDTHDGSIN